MFKKRTAPTNIQAATKRIRDDDDDATDKKDKGDNSSTQNQISISEYKELQKRRKMLSSSQKGLSNEILAVQGPESERIKAEKLAAEQAAIAAAEGNQNIQTGDVNFGDMNLKLGLNSNFGRGAVASSEETAASKHLEKFLEGQLEKEFGQSNKLGQFNKSSKDGNLDGSGNDEDDDHSKFLSNPTQHFFDNLPQHLILPDELRTDTEKEKNPIWSTGLVEVEVSTEKRLLNMVKGEEAKKKMLADRLRGKQAMINQQVNTLKTSFGNPKGKSGGSDGDKNLKSDGTSGNLAATDSNSNAASSASNIITPSIDSFLLPPHLSEQQQRAEQDRALGSRFQQQFQPRYDRTGAASDDQAVAQFKERTKHMIGQRRGPIHFPR